jgi:hypothetical protein
VKKMTRRQVFAATDADDLTCALVSLGKMTIADLDLLAHAIRRELETRQKSAPKVRKGKR